ncbi:hypothetical protein KKF59_04105 [Patescibacteria group bacterium]|nr:hypothetical protein [Patescibacteria group bacterium]MBU1034436.1 hypothetical protein [Patescibacteria group bacterium]MBU1629981.1 hypothetical protein [Patescibacteria group bacterium]MBU1908276.1 hypothetical protein [Patescibacteria group bacterium]
MFGLSNEETRQLRPLKTPRKIQDFLEEIPINFEPEGDTCLSPRRVLRERRAHCIEAAMLAALALRIQGERPLVLDLEAAPHDDDHVIVPFKQHGCWGAISKTNHAVLRYREPVYRTIRELVLSFFHEYTDGVGRKTLRSYSQPVDLSRFDKRGWMTSEEDVWYVAEYLTEIPHAKILSRPQIATLRKADPLERDVGEITQWKKGAL